MKHLLFMLLFWSSLLQASAQRRDYIAELNETYTSGLFRTGQAHFLVPMHDPAATASLSVFQYLQGRVPGVQVYGAHTVTPAVLYRWGSPVFFLDEVRVDARLLASVPLTDIAIIKVFTPPFLGSFGGANGAIAVYTKDGDEVE